jgi:apolipoprotein N-acyltransferase
VDPLGRVVAKAGLLTRENLVATVRLRDEPTLYARLGDWPGWLALAALLAALAGRRVASVKH